jgi:hypothetical protein
MALKASIDLTVNKPDFKSMKAEIKELTVAAQQAVMKFGEFSPEAAKAEKALASARDRMEDFNDRVKAVNPDKFSQINTVVQGVARGFQAAQGAMALFGNESKDLERTMVKLQGAMALAEGLEGLGKIEQQFKSIFNNVIDGAKRAFNAIKAAIGSTGIGLLVVALGSIVSYWDDIKFAIMGVSEETKKAKLEQDKYNQSIKDLNRERELLLYGELAAKKSELLEIETETNQLYDKQAVILKQLSSIEGGRKLSGIKADVEREASLRAAYNTAQLRLEKLTNLEIAVRKAIGKIEQDDAARSLAIAQNLSDKNQSQKDKDAQKEKDRLATLARLQQELRESERLRRLSMAETEDQERKIKYDNERLALRDKYQKDLQDFKDNQEALKLISATYLTDIATAQANFDKQEEERKKENLAKDKALQQEGLKNIITSTDKFNAQYKKSYDERVAIEDATKQLLIDSTMTAFSILSDLNTQHDILSEAAAKRSFERQKKLSILETLVSTYFSAQKAYESQFKPSADASSPIRGAIAAAFSVAQGLAKVAIIKNKNYTSGSTGGSAGGGGQMGGGGMPQMSAPRIGSTLPPVGQFDTKVFVTEGDIRRTSNRVDSTKKVSVVK